MREKNTKCKMVTVSISASIFRKEIAVLLLLANSLLLFSGCGQNTVEVKQLPMQGSVKYLDKDFEGKNAELLLEPNQEAVTEWDFGCQNDFEFDIEEASKLASGQTVVRLRIKRVVITLSAPVTLWLPKDASPEVVAHERGHETICRLIYKDSKRTAQRAAEAVIGKTFEAEGKDQKEALNKALLNAQEYVCQIYHGEASQDVGLVSEIYDDLDQNKSQDKNEKASSDELVKQAFAKFKRVGAGVKKKL